jgi:hypothetical protein
VYNVAGYFRRFYQSKSDGFLTGSPLNPIKNKLNDRESQMTFLSPVTTHQRQEMLVGKWNPPPVTVIQALPILTSAEIIGQEASGLAAFTNVFGWMAFSAL